MVSWSPDLVTFGHDLVTKGGVWAALKCFDCSGPSFNYNKGRRYILIT